MGRTSFVLFNDLLSPISELTDEEAGKLFKAILHYQNGEKPDDLASTTGMAFSFIKQQLDRSAEQYLAMCERNKRNGEKGGRPPKPKKPTGSSKTDRLLSKPKKPTLTLPDPDPDPDIKENIPPSKKPKKKYADYVTMTVAEHQKLVDKYGRGQTATMIDKLDAYKGSKGKRYKSDYHAILSWVVEAVRVEEERAPPNTMDPELAKALQERRAEHAKTCAERQQIDA